QYALPVADVPATGLALLSSVADTTLPDGAPVGRLAVYGTDGNAQRFDVRLGQQTGRAVSPDEAGSALPTATPPGPRRRNVDYVGRLPLSPGTTVGRVELENVA